jgi:hypothetical protein
MFWETAVYSSATSLAMYQGRALVSSLSAFTMPVICCATCFADLAGNPALLRHAAGEQLRKVCSFMDNGKTGDKIS